MAKKPRRIHGFPNTTISPMETEHPPIAVSPAEAERNLFRGKLSQYREIVRMLVAVVEGECDAPDEVVEAARAMLAEEIPS